MTTQSSSGRSGGRALEGLPGGELIAAFSLARYVDLGAVVAQAVLASGVAKKWLGKRGREGVSLRRSRPVLDQKPLPYLSSNFHPVLSIKSSADHPISSSGRFAGVGRPRIAQARSKLTHNR